MKSTRLLFVLIFAVAAYGAAIDSSQLSSKITLGDTVADMDATFFMASLKMSKIIARAQTWLHFCGGCLIHIKFILTAAQCIIMMQGEFGQDPDSVAAFIGSLDLNGPMTLYHIENIRRHDGYNPNDMYNTAAYDIGAIKLRDWPDRPDNSKIVNLGYFYNCLTLGMTTGWGSTRRSKLENVFSKSFKRADLAERLQSLLITIRRGRGENYFRQVVNEDEENLLFGYGPTSDEHNSVGDAGNPLIVQYDYVKYLAGITAYVPSSLVNVPNFFVSTEFHLTWIHQVMVDLAGVGSSNTPNVAPGSNPEVITLSD